jgi:hypothetical protein
MALSRSQDRVSAYLVIWWQTGKEKVQVSLLSIEDIESQGKIVNSEDIESKGKIVNYEPIKCEYIYISDSPKLELQPIEDTSPIYRPATNLSRGFFSV